MIFIIFIQNKCYLRTMLPKQKYPDKASTDMFLLLTLCIAVSTVTSQGTFNGKQEIITDVILNIFFKIMESH